MKKLAVTKTVLFLIILVLFLSSCGKQNDPIVSSGKADKEIFEFDLEEISAKAVFLMGDNAKAAYAILKASDRGFHINQICNGIRNNELTADGDIKGYPPPSSENEQNTLSSNLLPTGKLLASSDPMKLFGNKRSILLVRSGNGKEDIIKLFNSEDNQELSNRWLIWVLGTTASGYSVQQITDAMDDNIGFADPENLGGVPVIFDDNGELLPPDREFDWPFKGANILEDLRRKNELSKKNMVEVLVIGLVNSGYSDDQITDAIKFDTIGMCLTDETDNTSQLTPCIIDNESIVGPHASGSGHLEPAQILVKNIVPTWPKIQDNQPGGGFDKKPEMDKASVDVLLHIKNPKIREEWYILEQRSKITVEEKSEGLFSIVGDFYIEMERAIPGTTGSDAQVGERWIMEGTLSSKENQVLDDWSNKFKVNADYTAFHFFASGDLESQRIFTVDDVFTGSLDDEFSGAGDFFARFDFEWESKD